MKSAVQKAFRFWCEGCKYVTPHTYRPNAPAGEVGLVYRCDRCELSSEHSAYRAEMSMAEN